MYILYITAGLLFFAIISFLIWSIRKLFESANNFMFLLDYDYARRLILTKFKESYEMLKRKDIVVFLNNNARINQKDFGEFVQKLVPNFKRISGLILYNKFCNLMGGEEDLISYLIILLEQEIAGDKTIGMTAAIKEKENKKE